MQHHFETQTQNLTGRLSSGVSGMIETLVARYKHNQVYRGTLAELRTLSDRDLTDLGLSRAKLPTIARRAADMKVKL